MKTVDELIEEALEFGVTLEDAQKLCPALLYYVNHPNGMEEFIKREPFLASRLSCIRKH